MARNRFVNTNPSTRETQKVDLADGDFVLFKKVLTNGEKRHISLASFGNLKGNLDPKSGQSEISIDWEAMELERVFTWLHGWSFVDTNLQPVQFNRDNVERLDDETFEEIKSLLDEHVGAKEKEKNEVSPEAKSRLKRVGSGSTTAPS